MEEQQKQQLSSNSMSNNYRRTREWIDVDESAQQMLSRIFMERPFMISLPPPLHRLPFRLGNVLEIFGPSPSAKTHILTEAAINFILPKEWNGVHYGGFNHLVMFIDLDCRFDILRMSEMLKHRIMKVEGLPTFIPFTLMYSKCMYSYLINSSAFLGWVIESYSTAARGLDLWHFIPKWSPASREHKYIDRGFSNFNGDELLLGEPNNYLHDEALHDFCMRRFLYVRCSNSFEFLTTLKILHNRLKKEKEVHGLSAHLLLIDSIGAFHWIDRATTFLPIRDSNRKGSFLQYVSETVVREIKKLLQLHPMLVIATKSSISGDKHILASHLKGDSTNVVGNSQQRLHRDYMPSAWQSFVTHRLLIRASDNQDSKGSESSQPFYLSEWLLPQLNLSDKFVVKEAGIFLAS